MSQDPKDERIRALEDEVRRLNVMLESAPDFITRITVDGNFLYVNRVAPGYVRENIVGTSMDNYVPVEHRERAHAAIRAVIESHSVQQYANMGQVSADQIGYYLTRIGPIIEDGQVTSLVMVATDVTALEESRTLLQVALNATGLGIWTYEPKTGLGSLDDTTRRIFGVDAAVDSPNLTETLQQRIHPQDRELVASELAKAMTSGRYGPLEHRIIVGSGEQRWVAASGMTLSSPHGEVLRVVGSVMDITHRKALEARLREAQKLESIGRLAGGVAHDFNNMLTAILGNVDLASRVATLAEAQPLLEEVRVTAERSAALTAQLLAFARRQVIAPKVLDPSELLRRLEPILRRLLGERAVLTLELLGTGRVRADESQLEQVVLNLITNARDSLIRGGRVVLATSDVVVAEHGATHAPELAPGSYLCLSVSDDGPGISAGALPQIFEPFFTTRPGGTGLGLATCYGIVKQSGGHIAVSSEPGAGATFTVYLPRVSEAESAPALASSPRVSAPGRERVLLVEDESVVRAILQRTLERAGYQVEVATNASEALELAAKRSRAEPFDLLVTDVVMPGMNGWELGKRVEESWPGLPVLYISGYTEDVTKGGGVVDASVPFLQKPFLPAELLGAVRKLLDARS